ncbi:flagellar filament capping protein FliD [Georgenia satyanarayanai]|uniref:flagellar filament capping protein FliD n=1 Tax=Georgenia satyanarayanai TaxID=860221 RepID=UPI0012649A11|nr:flagellar filament capping protein FliD [Georgenia satyanarayanai]
MTIGIDGMASGLDTGAIIDGLVKIQANQQVLLKQKSTAASSLVTALQGLNSRVSSLATAAKKVADADSWAVTKGSSSSDAVTVSSSPDAKPGSVELSVTRLASGQVSLLKPADLPSSFTIAVGGESHEVVPSSTHADDIAAAVNELTAKTGVSATRVRTGTDADGNATYHLQLTGRTGEANAFSVHPGTDTSDGTAVASATNAVVKAQDAAIKLWPSAAEPLELTSATNTFDGVIDGVNLTVSKVSADPVTVTVTSDAEAQRKLAEELVSNVTVVLSEIASRSRTTTETNSAGNTVVTGGLFSGDSAIRFLTSDVQSTLTNPVGGKSPSDIGISMDRYGKVSLDKATFDKAMSEDAEGTMAMMQTVAARVGEVAARASNAKDGTLTTKITSQESVVKDLGSQVTKWDERLAARRAQLVAQFSSMEVRLSQLQSTQSWLSNQMAGLSASRQ